MLNYMNNLGAALLHKQKQGITTSGVDLHAIQQKINAERQQLLDTINALKTENESLKAENESLKTENESLKTENESLKSENETLKEETVKKTPEVKFVFM